MFNITYTTVRDLVWRDAEHTIFDCFVFFNHINEEVPFGCAQAEVSIYPHVASIWERGVAGEFGPIAEYTPEPEQPAPVTPETL